MSVLLALLGSAVGLIALIFWFRFAVYRSGPALVALVGMVAFSSHILALLYNAGMPAPAVRFLILSKDILTYTLLIALMWLRRRDRGMGVYVVCGACLVVLLSVWTFPTIGTIPLQTLLLSLRDLLVPAVAILIAVALPENERRRALLGAYIVIAFAAIYALIEYALPPSFLTDVIHVGQYWRDVKLQPRFLWNYPGIGLLPGNSFVSLDANSTRRLAGSFGDPLAAGYLLAIGITIGLALPKTRLRILALGPIAAALALTFTRAGWIIALLGVCGFVFSARSRRVVAAGIGVFALSPLIILAVPAFRAYILAILNGQNGSTLGHLQALTASLAAHYSILGRGVGSTGAVAAGSAALDASSQATESVLATIALQLGGLGAIGYGALLAIIVVTALRREASQRRPMSGVWIGTAGGLALSLVVSEQLISFNSGFIPILITVTGLLSSRSTARSGNAELDSCGPVESP